MPTAEATKCVCGGPMEDNGSGAFFCANCDTVQPQERVQLARRKTPQDIRFDMYWLRIINKEYVDNTKKSAPTGDAEETEGGTTNGEE